MQFLYRTLLFSAVHFPLALCQWVMMAPRGLGRCSCTSSDSYCFVPSATRRVRLDEAGDGWYAIAIELLLGCSGVYYSPSTSSPSCKWDGSRRRRSIECRRPANCRLRGTPLHISAPRSFLALKNKLWHDPLLTPYLYSPTTLRPLYSVAFTHWVEY